MKVKRGEIWMAEIPEADKQGCVQCGRRPVYIYSNNKFNEHSPVVNYYPLTSKVHKESPVHVIVGEECGLKTTSAIMVECSGTIDKRNLLFKIGECSKSVKQSVLWAYIFQSGFCNVETLNKKLEMTEMACI